MWPASGADRRKACEREERCTKHKGHRGRCLLTPKLKDDMARLEQRTHELQAELDAARTNCQRLKAECGTLWGKLQLAGTTLGAVVRVRRQSRTLAAPTAEDIRAELEEILLESLTLEETSLGNSGNSRPVPSTEAPHAGEGTSSARGGEDELEVRKRRHETDLATLRAQHKEQSESVVSDLLPYVLSAPSLSAKGCVAAGGSAPALASGAGADPSVDSGARCGAFAGGEKGCEKGFASGAQLSRSYRTQHAGAITTRQLLPHPPTVQPVQQQPAQQPHMMLPMQQQMLPPMQQMMQPMQQMMQQPMHAQQQPMMPMMQFSSQAMQQSMMQQPMQHMQATTQQMHMQVQQPVQHQYMQQLGTQQQPVQQPMQLPMQQPAPQPMTLQPLEKLQQDLQLIQAQVARQLQQLAQQQQAGVA